MRSMDATAMSTEALSAALSAAGADKPEKVIQLLAAEAFIESAAYPSRLILGVGECDDRDAPAPRARPPLWEPTVKGRALAKARIGKPMTRSKAAKLLEDLLARVHQANSDPVELYSVERVDVFGSYLNETRQEVGDVDLRLVYTARGTGDEHLRLSRAEARRSGRRFSTLLDELSYADTRFKSRIRGRSNRIDIQFDQDAPRPLPDGATAVTVWRTDGDR